MILAADIMELLCDSVESQKRSMVNHKVLLVFKCDLVWKPSYQNPSLQFAWKMLVATLLSAFLVQEGNLSCYELQVVFTNSKFQNILNWFIAKMNQQLTYPKSGASGSRVLQLLEHLCCIRNSFFKWPHHIKQQRREGEEQDGKENLFPTEKQYQLSTRIKYPDPARDLKLSGAGSELEWSETRIVLCYNSCRQFPLQERERMCSSKYVGIF